MQWTAIYRLIPLGRSYGSNIADLGGGGSVDVDADTREEIETLAKPLIAKEWPGREFKIVDVVKTDTITDRRFLRNKP